MEVLIFALIALVGAGISIALSVAGALQMSFVIVRRAAMQHGDTQALVDDSQHLARDLAGLSTVLSTFIFGIALCGAVFLPGNTEGTPMLRGMVVAAFMLPEMWITPTGTIAATLIRAFDRVAGEAGLEQAETLFAEKSERWRFSRGMSHIMYALVRPHNLRGSQIASAFRAQPSPRA